MRRHQNARVIFRLVCYISTGLWLTNFWLVCCQPSPTWVNGSEPLRSPRLRGTQSRMVALRAVPSPPSGEGAFEASSAYPAAGDIPPPPLSEVEQLFQTVLAELPELQKVEDARLGMRPDKQYIFQQGDADRKNPIYKRKYEVLGMTLNQQETYMKSFNRAVKAAEKLDSVKKIIELTDTKDKRILAEVNDLKEKSPLAFVFFKDIVPEVLDDPLSSAIQGLIATAVLLLALLCFCLCILPPVPPSAD